MRTRGSGAQRGTRSVKKQPSPLFPLQGSEARPGPGWGEERSFKLDERLKILYLTRLSFNVAYLYMKSFQVRNLFRKI